MEEAEAGQEGAAIDEFSIADFLQRGSEIILSPGRVWERLQGPPESVEGLFRSYALPLFAVTPICSLTAFLFIDTVGRAPFIRFMLAIAVWYALTVSAVKLISQFITKLATHFEGATVTELQAAKLYVYSMTPYYFGGLVQLAPGLGVLQEVLLLYSVYLFYEGIPAMTGVDREHRRAFCGIALCGVGVITLAIWLIVNSMGGGY